MEDITSKAAELAARMTMWLAATGVGNDIYRLVVNGSATTDEPAELYAADLIEWCRTARDILTQVGAEPLTYSCGTPVLHRTGRCDCVSLGNLKPSGYSPGELAAAKATDPWAE